jgi:hypothetical protein
MPARILLAATLSAQATNTALSKDPRLQDVGRGGVILCERRCHRARCGRGRQQRELGGIVIREGDALGLTRKCDALSEGADIFVGRTTFTSGSKRAALPLS